MDIKDQVIVEELHRTLRWMGKNPRTWEKVNILEPNEASPEEIISAIDMFVNEKLYVPLALYLANEFVSYRGSALMRKILIDVILSQWNENTWDIAIKAMKETIIEYSRENNNTTND